MLVPTTILADQHGRTFSERLADFPVTSRCFRRFQTAKEQKAALERLAEGKIDIVIGTHRLLVARTCSSTTSGLIVVDEEHRFGVKHKERLKQLRLATDVLTLTATPIPRTLHLSLAGLRDMTLMQTPPRDRSPVLTFVEPWDDGLLEEAIRAELDRGGQVFFVHNRIETIDAIAATGPGARAARARRRGARPDARPTSSRTVMRRFVNGEVDVLVSTMIVESGLDVPNANTMFVHDADQFGLAQLYQLRGRVGRSHRRAYCYLLVPDAIDAGRRATAQGARAPHRARRRATGSRSRTWSSAAPATCSAPSSRATCTRSGSTCTCAGWRRRCGRSGGRARPSSRAPPDVVLDRPAHLPDGYVPDDDAKLDLYRRLARAGHPAKLMGCGRKCASGSAPSRRGRDAARHGAAPRAGRGAGPPARAGPGRRGPAYVPRRRHSPGSPG